MRHLRAILCDADGTLFPSEEPAFDASAEVTNRMLESIGAPARYAATELRLATSGRNFRVTAADLAVRAGVPLPADELERWVQEERRVVSAHLSRVLFPDAHVTDPLRRLGERYALAVVTSSATTRVRGCLAATGLADLFAVHGVFSAEDSLSPPESKPSPAIYRHAGEALGVSGREALAVEDTPTGALSAVRAGFPTLGFVGFVAEDERPERVASLRQAGVAGIVASWAEVERLALEATVVTPR